jgi:hypothetical protein
VHCFGGSVRLFCVGWYSLLLRGWLKLFTRTHMGVGALLRWVGMPCCVGWYSLLWKGWLKLLKTNPKGIPTKTNRHVDPPKQGPLPNGGCCKKNLSHPSTKGNTNQRQKGKPTHRSKAPNYLGAHYSPAGAADRSWLTR